MDNTSTFDGTIALTRCLGLTFRRIRGLDEPNHWFIGRYQLVDIPRKPHSNGT
ncbi:MAG: hypothetical protein H6686_07280 [Fibrobacteria bacterium]|nr:hypothetical protein [Fibrobacteria bacterium]